MMLHTHSHYTLSCNVVTYLTALKSLQTFHNNVQMKLKSRKNVWSLCSNQKIRYKWLLECQIDYDQNFHCCSFHGNKNSSYITFTTVLTLWRNYKSKNSLYVNNHEKFLQFVFHNFVWSASLEKANARLLEELQEKELEYANLQEEVRDLNDKLNKARIQHSKELGTIG